MNKKLGLILLPLVPLSAIGVVSLVNRALPSAPPVVECKPATTVEVVPVGPQPQPAPRPAPRPAPPHTPTAD